MDFSLEVPSCAARDRCCKGGAHFSKKFQQGWVLCWQAARSQDLVRRDFIVWEERGCSKDLLNLRQPESSDNFQECGQVCPRGHLILVCVGWTPTGQVPGAAAPSGGGHHPGVYPFGCSEPPGQLWAAAATRVVVILNHKSFPMSL